MIINKETEEVIIVSDTPAGQVMSISQSEEVQAHIIKVLTDYSYRKKLESAIRETVSNSIDSMVEADRETEGVTVRLKENGYGSWYFESEDTGIGLDEEGFNKYIMGIGESTKRDNPKLLGMYGAGAKSPLSKVSSFYFICRKDGVERKFTLFKGASRPESRKEYERATKKGNGVLVHIDVPRWEYIGTWKAAMKEQLCYFPHIIYEVDGETKNWNDYTIFRSNDFEFSQLSSTNFMHISLGGVYYPIEWERLEIEAIYIPIALKFSLEDGIRPTFSREDIQYDDKTATIIKNKIHAVAKWFVERYNNEQKEYEDILEAWPYISQEGYNISVEGKTFEISGLLGHTSVKIKEVKVKDITFKTPKYYADTTFNLISDYEIVGHYDYNDKFRTVTNSRRGFRINLKDRIIDKKKIVLVNSVPVGNFRDFLKNKFDRDTTFIAKKKDRSLGLDGSQKGSNYHYILTLEDIPRKNWRDVIKEFQHVQTTFFKNAINGKLLDQTPGYEKWLIEHKEWLKNNRGKVGSNYKSLNKQKGDITIYRGREFKWGGYTVFEKEKEAIVNLPKRKFLSVYFLKDDVEKKENKNWIYDMRHLFNNIQFVALNPSEVKHVLNNKQFMTKKQFIEARPISRYVTAWAIQDYMNSVPDNEDMIYEAFPRYKSLKAKLELYLEKVPKADATVRRELMKLADEHNLWDQNVYSDFLKFKRIMLDFGFLNYLDIGGREMTDGGQKIINNIIYILLKHKKLNCKMIQEFELVPKLTAVPEVVEEVEENIQEEELIA